MQHTATHGNAWQCTATHCNTRQHTAIHFDTLQHTTTRCITLQHTRDNPGKFQIFLHSHEGCLKNPFGFFAAIHSPEHTATYCDTLDHSRDFPAISDFSALISRSLDSFCVCVVLTSLCVLCLDFFSLLDYSLSL